MASMTSIEANICKEINEEVGSDTRNLYRAAVLLERYRDRLMKLEKKISNKESTAIKTALESLPQATEGINFQQIKLQSYNDKLAEYFGQVNATVKEVQPELEGLMKLDHFLQYLYIVEEIHEICRDLQETFDGYHDSKNTMLMDIYTKLYTEQGHGDCILSRLRHTHCDNLKTFALNATIYWHSVLQEYFTEQFQKMLEAINWGKKSFDLNSNGISALESNSIMSMAQLLIRLRLPAKAANGPMESVKIFGKNTNIVFPPITNLCKCLLDPFKARFNYHFTGNKQTNRLDKPEWVFNQVLNWIKSTHKIVGKAFQTVITETGYDLNIRLEFIRGMIQMVLEKQCRDIEAISEDSNLFAHLIDATVAFDVELRESFGYPNTFPSPMSVVLQPVYLLKWISIEENFCLEHLDIILRDDNQWHMISGNTFDDELKIPKSADLFIRLLDAMKERYSSLIQPGHQLQFLSLQLEVIQNYRSRLLQLYNNHAVDIVTVLNAIDYIKMVLVEWGGSIHYLHLHAAVSGQIEDSLNSVFDQPILEFTHLFHQLLDKLITTLMDDIKANCSSYRNDCWSKKSKDIVNKCFTLSPSAAAMFESILNALNDYEKRMSANIFVMLVRSIAEELDEHLLNNLIMNVKFSNNGAAQFNYDLTSNLLPLFGKYCKRAELLFKMTNDANKLLNFSKGVAYLLYENLKWNDSIEEKLTMLKDLGIVYLKPKSCIKVLERRSDIKE